MIFRIANVYDYFTSIAVFFIYFSVFMIMDVVLKSKLLSQYPNVVQGMSTILGGSEDAPFYNNLSFWVGDSEHNVKQNRNKFFESLGIDQKHLAIPQQVHSADVKIVEVPGYYRTFDGLITNKKNVFLIISTADCFPVMIYDKSKQVIAGIHSGWRGTQKAIVPNGIEMMIKEFNSNLEDMLVYIGPGISRDKFEVGEDVANLFEIKYRAETNGKFFVDIKQVILDQLKDKGIPEENIEASELCSYCSSGYLHSYRRDRDKSGRMFCVIGMREEF
jgi:YfiH family protein